MNKNKLLILALLLMTTLVFGAFTRDWDEANPTDSTVANQIDEYNRYLRVDASDRLKNMFYGFIAGENTLSQHCQYLQFYEQDSVSQPSAGYGRLYALAVGEKCELHWQDEDGDEIQLTSGGKWNGAVLLADSVLTAAIADANITNALMADDSIDSGQYVDGSIDTAHIADANVTAAKIANLSPTAYTGGETTTFANGLIIKMGSEGSVAVESSTTVTFGAAFPNGVVSAVCSGLASANDLEPVTVTAVSTSAMTLRNNDGDDIQTIHWIVIGY